MSPEEESVLTCPIRTKTMTAEQWRALYALMTLPTGLKSLELANDDKKFKFKIDKTKPAQPGNNRLRTEVAKWPDELNVELIFSVGFLVILTDDKLQVSHNFKNFSESLPADLPQHLDRRQNVVKQPEYMEWLFKRSLDSACQELLSLLIVLFAVN